MKCLRTFCQPTTTVIMTHSGVPFTLRPLVTTPKFLVREDSGSRGKVSGVVSTSVGECVSSPKEGLRVRQGRLRPRGTRDSNFCTDVLRVPTVRYDLVRESLPSLGVSHMSDRETIGERRSVGGGNLGTCVSWLAKPLNGVRCLGHSSGVSPGGEVGTSRPDTRTGPPLHGARLDVVVSEGIVDPPVLVGPPPPSPGVANVPEDPPPFLPPGPSPPRTLVHGLPVRGRRLGLFGRDDGRKGLRGHTRRTRGNVG